MQELSTYRVGRLFFRSMSGEESEVGAAPPERVEIEMRPEGVAASQGTFAALITVAVMVALGAWAAVTAWQPFMGPIMIVVAIVIVILTMRARAGRQAGWRITADPNELLLEATSPAKDVTRLRLDVRSVERIAVDDEPDHHTLWAETRAGERVVLLEGLSDAEAKASAKSLRDTLPPPPS